MRSRLDFVSPPAGAGLDVGGQRVPLRLVRNPRARRYVLRLCPDGVARVTVPRGGSVPEAWRFVSRHLAWLEEQLKRHAVRSSVAAEWRLSSEVLFRGELVRLVAETGIEAAVCLGSEKLAVSSLASDLRPVVEGHLRRLAERELPLRVAECAVLHQLTVRRLSVRNQRSRWGSCSRRGTISLNWRLIQTPPFVRDYIILHELMHLREMNHSARFWRLVEDVCPAYRQAERWLKQHAALLRA
ncbi:MAG TPA: SprT family zinc-dependent metalloprotease [Verrucomicrobiae bacterium]